MPTQSPPPTPSPNDEKKDAGDLFRFATDDDGGTRDLNLTGVPWAHLSELLACLEEDFDVVQCLVNGNPTRTPNWPEIVSRVQTDDASLQVDFESSKQLVSGFQLFVARGDGAPPYVELSFAPTDVAATTTGEDLNAWFHQLMVAASADDFFFRYENAGWAEGDVGPRSGVVATSTWVAAYEARATSSRNRE